MTDENLCVICNGAVVPVNEEHANPSQAEYEVAEPLASSAYNKLLRDGAHVDVHGTDKVWNLRGSTVITYHVGDKRRFRFTAREENYRMNAAQHLSLITIELKNIVDATEDHANPFKPEAHERVVYEE